MRLSRFYLKTYDTVNLIVIVNRSDLNFFSHTQNNKTQTYTLKCWVFGSQNLSKIIIKESTIFVTKFINAHRLK